MAFYVRCDARIEKRRRKNTQNRDFSRVRSQHEDAMKTTRRRANHDRYVFLYAENGKNRHFCVKTCSYSTKPGNNNSISGAGAQGVKEMTVTSDSVKISKRELVTDKVQESCKKMLLESFKSVKAFPNQTK